MASDEWPAATDEGARAASQPKRACATEGRGRKWTNPGADWPRYHPLGWPPLAVGAGLAAGVMAEVTLHEEGLEGSRFVVDVLELRGRGARREAHVQYHALFDEVPPEAAPGDEAPLLREWVSAAALAPPPPPPPHTWHRGLKAGDAAEAQHEGGWWQVTVHSRLPGNARLQEPPRVIVEATGYGVRRTVALHDLRPPSNTGG